MGLRRLGAPGRLAPPAMHRTWLCRWRGGVDSNHRQFTVLQTGALAAELPPHVPGIRRAEKSQ